MPGTRPSRPTTPAATASACGESNTWPRIWVPMSCSLPTRETTIAEATEISRAGICATSASPTARVTYEPAAAPASMPCMVMPMTKPPTVEMNRISRPAIASPRTNLLAPSIEPKKSASSATSRRRWRATFSSMRPALRSASIAICLPGIASSAKRAPTSAMRSAPLVTTTKLMTTRIANTIRPTAKLPPIRK